MHKVVALMRVTSLSAMSYRLSLLLQLAGVLVSVVPLYFVANALQPLMADAIQAEGGHYFAFVLVGMIAFSFITPAITSISGTIGSGISSGTLEAMISTPTRLPTLIAGLSGYTFVWLGARTLVLLLAGAALGANFVWDRMLFGAGIVGLVVLSYLPFGILAAAMVLAFRTAGPIGRAMVTLSALLGGVYYPTHVIPSWLEQLSAWIPLTYGLRALRQVVLDGQPLRSVAPDLAVLTAATAVLLALSTLAFLLAFRYARRTGTLMHY